MARVKMMMAGLRTGCAIGTFGRYGVAGQRDGTLATACGAWRTGWRSGSSDAESLASLDRAIELGCNFFDTAYAYGEGHSERLLGQTLKKHAGTRLYAATKIPPKNRQWPGKAEYRVEDVYPADHIHEYAETSLQNLGVDAIDLLQLHVWNDAWADDEGWQRAAERLKNRGLIRAFGISVNRWQPANVLRALDTGLVDAVQVVYNIFDQNPEDELFPYCREHEHRDHRARALRRGEPDGHAARRFDLARGGLPQPLFQAREPEADPRARRAAAAVAMPPGMTLPELALRFILESPDVSTVIPGMRKLAHVEANMDASGQPPLPAEVMAELRRHRWERTTDFE
jgi:aryl-alcohol dehydrogenase-like predicted oxidoreductase